MITTLNGILLGKEAQIKLALCCLFANGHLLIEDQPGMGKTLVSHALARVLGLSFNRIQFTSDMLPSDVLGISIFNKDENNFHFVEGPVFSQLVLADEINRATPKSQSALLEAMEEHQVTIDGETRALPSPFFVIATQNPESQTGTFPLPESQLDRFLMRIHLGYPDPDAERELLMGGDRRPQLNSLGSMVDASWLESIWHAVEKVKVTEPLVDYVQRLVQYTRRESDFATGISPRGALGLLKAARAWALIHERSHVVPEDVQAVLPSVVEHRLRSTADHSGHGGGALTQRMLARVDVIG
ncbi:MAG: AAA family ATPase [Pseudomonadales bacterium]|nr:AAA family ATPase [Pseudomonadales bacterium]